MTSFLHEQQRTLPEGLSIRPAQMSDVTATVALFNTWTQAVNGEDQHNEDDLKTEWSSEHFDLENSTRVILTPDNQMIAYVEVWDVTSPPVHPWVWMRVHPDYEGQGIGEFLLDWAETRCQQAIDRCPPDARVSMMTDTQSNYEPAHDLYKRMGLNAIRHAYKMKIEMDSAPDVPQAPEGIILRTYHHPDELETVIRAFTDAFSDHWGHVERPLEETLKRWQEYTETDKKFDPTLWFLAGDDASGEIAGVSLCRTTAWDDPHAGYVSILGVRRPWRRRGLGMVLLKHSFREYWKRGTKVVTLGVDASSLTGATRLYERAGMHVARQWTTYEKELRPGVELAKTSLEQD